MSNNEELINNPEEEISTGSGEGLMTDSKNTPLYTAEEILSTCEGIWKRDDEKEIIALDLKCDWLLEQGEVNQDLNLKAQIIAVKNKSQSLIADFNERDPSKKVFSIFRRFPYFNFLIKLFAMGVLAYCIFQLISKYNSAADPYLTPTKKEEEPSQPASTPQPIPKIQVVRTYFDPTHLSEEMIQGITSQAYIEASETPTAAQHTISLGYDPADLLTDPSASSKASMKNPNYLMIMVDGAAKCKTNLALIQDFPDITMERSLIIETLEENVKAIASDRENTPEIIKAICSCLKKD